MDEFGDFNGSLRWINFFLRHLRDSINALPSKPVDPVGRGRIEIDVESLLAAREKIRRAQKIIRETMEEMIDQYGDPSNAKWN